MHTILKSYTNRATLFLGCNHRYKEGLLFDLVDRLEISISQMTIHLLLFMQMLHCHDFYQNCPYMCVTCRVSYKKQELMTLSKYEFTPVLGEIRVTYLLSFFRELLYLITFLVLCCDVCYDFHIKTMLDSFLPLVVFRRVNVMFSVCFRIVVSNVLPHHISIRS
jgi:hypothetical protein